MDENGIAVARMKRAAANNGHVIHGHGRLVAAVREKVKARYKTTRGSAKARAAAKDPDGQHVTMTEAAKILKMSDANVRLWVKAGKLPAPSYERRDSKKRPGIMHNTQVLLRDDVVRAAAAYKAEKKAKQ
jgi:hypothetical protein